jgi:hypothetical protein
VEGGSPPCQCAQVMYEGRDGFGGEGIMRTITRDSSRDALLILKMVCLYIYIYPSVISPSQYLFAGDVDQRSQRFIN